MRLHITLPDELVVELDRRTGRRSRSAFIAKAVEQALDDARRWELIESSVGMISNSRHAWDKDAADWVRAQRNADARRVG